MKISIQILLIILLSASFCNTADAQTSTKIKMGELPHNAHNLIHGKYAKYHVNGMYKKQSTKDVVTYQVELQKKSKVIDLIYNAEGDLLETRKTREIVFDGSEKPIKSSGGGGGGGHSGHNH